MLSWAFWIGVVLAVWFALSVAVALAAVEFLKSRDVEVETRACSASRDVEGDFRGVVAGG
jgi:hypothetical protein